MAAGVSDCGTNVPDVSFILHNFCSDVTRSPEAIMAVGQKDQDRALAAALSDSLWLAGQGGSATVTLVTEDYCITPHLDYKLDNFTEKVPHSSMENHHRFLPVTMNHRLCFSCSCSPSTRRRTSGASSWTTYSV